MSIETFASELCSRALTENRDTLLEHELYGLLRHGGLATPEFFTIPNNGTDPSLHLQKLPGDKVVVKIECPLITHKTEAGGVKICRNTPEDIAQTCRTMFNTVKDRVGPEVFASVTGLLVTEFIPNDDKLGSQLFVGMRFTPDMGHVMAMGLGGLEAEEYAAQFKPGQAMVMFSPSLLTPEQALAKFRNSYAYRKMTGKTREANKRCDDNDYLALIEFFSRISSDFSNNPKYGFTVKDFEINPFFVGNGRIVAVDAFMRFTKGTTSPKTTDLTKVASLLQPQTVALMGVSAKGNNVGRVILGNLKREKFPSENIRIIRPGGGEIDGVACLPAIADLPFTADLIVVAVAAEQVPDIMQEIIATRKAHSVVLIPGGMGETEGGKEKERLVLEALTKAREQGSSAPVIVGPNCLGIRSKPGKYDTLFIPESKLPLPTGHVDNTALVSQSGAFMITRMNLIPMLDCPYAISTGNQMDLTFTDFVEYLLDDPKTPTIGIYIEGFKPLDGFRLARLIKSGTENGKRFIVYKAGRTSEGASATSSHTASISGDYQSAVEILEDAGALIATTFAEFKAYMTLSGFLAGKKFTGTRLGAMSNAGYETVGIADNIFEKKFTLAKLSQLTKENIGSILRKYRLDSLVTIRNPLDLTPMAVDAAHAECLDAILQDDQVDAAVLGFVPMAITMRSLPPGKDPSGEDRADHPEALPALLKTIAGSSCKPLVVVVDSGALYDSLAEQIELAGVPCFRSSDFAMQTLQKFILHNLTHSVQN